VKQKSCKCYFTDFFVQIVIRIVYHLCVVYVSRDFMDANMERTKHILNYLYPLIDRANPELRDFMER